MRITVKFSKRRGAKLYLLAACSASIALGLFAGSVWRGLQ